MAKLDYEPQRPDHELHPELLIVAWLVCCLAGAFCGAAGTTVGAYLYYGQLRSDEWNQVPFRTIIAGVLAIFLTAPLLRLNARPRTWVVLLVGALFGLWMGIPVTFTTLFTGR